MENAVEALKIAFAVIMFVMALTLSVSSFSQANLAVTSLMNMNDRENEYTYVEPTQGLTRTVGIETVVTSMYRAMEQNIEIYFKDSSGDLLPLFYKTSIDKDGYIEKDSLGNSVEIYSIDSSSDNFEVLETVEKEILQMHIDIILAGTAKIENIVKNNYLSGELESIQDAYIDMYEEKIKDHFPNGLYEEFKDEQFIESFGEYCIEEGTAAEYTQRVITYQIK